MGGGMTKDRCDTQSPEKQAPLGPSVGSEQSELTVGRLTSEQLSIHVGDRVNHSCNINPTSTTRFTPAT